MKISRKKPMPVSVRVIAASSLVAPVISYDVDQPIVQIQTRTLARAGMKTASLALLERMQSRGLTALVVGNFSLSLDNLRTLLFHGSPEASAALDQLHGAARHGRISFLLGDRLVAPTPSENPTAFTARRANPIKRPDML